MSKRQYITEDLSGQVFFRLSVLSQAPSKKGARWVCKCECGNIKTISASNLRHGRTKSCGCLSIETTVSRSKSHGCAPRGLPTPEYAIWGAIRHRTSNPNNKRYDDYGGRGIGMCERWREFSNFLEDMGLRPSSEHSIERKDNALGYYKENCRWATRKEQSRNKRSNHMVTYKGEIRCVMEWSEIQGIAVDNLYYRFKVGWDVERALETPTRKITR